MTSLPRAAATAILERIDWLTNRGSRVMRAAALISWLGAVAATAIVFSRMGPLGWLVGLVALTPGWALWRYGRALGSSLDSAKVQAQMGDAVGIAKDKLAAVAGGIQTTRSQKLRGAIKVIRSVRALRSELAEFGLDLAGIAQVTSPASIALVAGSVLATAGLWLLALVGTALWLAF